MPTVRYTTVGGEIIAEKRGGGRKLFVPDPLGSTVALLNDSQVQTDTFAYWPYGETRDRTGSTQTPFRFVGSRGYYKDGGNRTYVRARTQDTQKGRWVTEDPLGFDSDDYNLYRYVGNNPTTMIDPTGTYRTIGCTAEQRELIRRAMDDLCERLKHESLLPKQFPGSACLQSRCGLAKGGHGAVIICRTETDPTCKIVPRNANCGHTPPPRPRQDIGLCPLAFNPRCGCLGSTIVHELLHSCIGDPRDKQTYECERDLYGPGTRPCPK